VSGGLPGSGSLSEGVSWRRSAVRARLAHRVDMVTATSLMAGAASQLANIEATPLRPDGRIAWVAPDGELSDPNPRVVR
jgi:hypothetical protein